MSESRRAARALVEPSRLRVESVHAPEESRRRYTEAVAALKLDSIVLRPAWQDGAATVLEVEILPAPKWRRRLVVLSFTMTALVVASAVLLLATEQGAARFLVPLFTVLAVLGLPFLVAGMSSTRLAEEATLQRRLRAALADAPEAYPPARRWEDE